MYTTGVLRLLLLLWWVLQSDCAPVDLWVPQDSWTGGYSCGFYYSLRIIINSYDENTQQVATQITATQYGYGSYSYSYSANGTANNNSLLLVTDSKPFPYVISGTVTANGNTYSGNTSACPNSVFTVTRTRTNNIHACGMTLSTPGYYHLMKDITALQSLNGPCISVTSNGVTVNNTQFNIDGGRCAKCTGILVSAGTCQLTHLQISNFAVGVNISTSYSLLSDITITATRTLDSAIGIVGSTFVTTLQNIEISNIATNFDVYGLSLKITNTSIMNIQVRNLTSLSKTLKSSGDVPISSGVFFNNSYSFGMQSVTISQISGWFAAYGMYIQNTSQFSVRGANVDTVTANGVGASAIGIYFTGNTNFLFASGSATTITANASNAIASGLYFSGKGQTINSTSSSYVVGDSAFGVKTSGSYYSVNGFTISNIRGNTEVYGIYSEGQNSAINTGTIRHINSLNKAYAISVPSAYLFSVTLTNISIVQGSNTCGIHFGANATNATIISASVLQVDSGITVYVDASNVTSTTTSPCTQNYATQVCYPSLLFPTCCTNCKQVPSPDQCTFCDNTTCTSGYECVQGNPCQVRRKEENNDENNDENNNECVQENSCQDINECTQYNICGSGYNCSNSIGSYNCTDINECLNARICSSGFTCKNTDGSYTCQDINECTLSNACPASTQCINKVGSYQCKAIDYCATVTCPTGFYCVNGNGTYNCTDQNECNEDTEGDDICGAGYVCKNENGSYSCIDINECQNPNVCGTGFNCTNLPGFFNCTDYDECSSLQLVCPVRQVCINTIGSFECKDTDPCAATLCSPGYQCINSSGNCTDIDECANLSRCDSGFNCYNTNGSFLCVDIDECQGPEPMCPAHYHCVNKIGYFNCSADPPSLKWFNYSQSQTSPYYANFSWKFEQGLYPINHYLLVVETPNNEKRVWWNVTIYNFYHLPIDSKYSFYIYAVDSSGIVSSTNSPIVIKNLFSLSCNSCFNGGVCGSDGLCACVDGWTGPYCTYQTYDITVKCNRSFPHVTINSTSSLVNVTVLEIYELSANGEKLDETKVDMKKAIYTFFAKPTTNPNFWSYTLLLSDSTIVYIEMIQYNTTTEVSFAGKNYTIPPNTLKLNIIVRGWQFTNETHQLAVKMDISFPGQLHSYETDNPYSMNWVNLEVNGARIYASFLDSAIIDGRVDTVDFVWNGDGTVTAKIPYFSQFVQIDPSYNILVQGSDGLAPWQGTNSLDQKTAILIGTVLGALFVVLVVLIVLRKRIFSFVQVKWGGKDKKTTVGDEDL